LKVSKKRFRKRGKHQLLKEQQERKSMAAWLSAVAILFIIGFSIYVWYSVAHEKEIFLPIGSGGILVILAALCVRDWWRHRPESSESAKK
jgi:hypothetical protein